MGVRSARNPVNTEATKSKQALPTPTAKLLQQFPIIWELDSAVGSTWRNKRWSVCFEHFVRGTFNNTEYLFVSKGSSYGRKYYVFRGAETKPLFTAQNLQEIALGLTAITSKNKGALAIHLLHPSQRIRQFAERLYKECL